MDDLTHLDLFTGIGGFTLAAEAEGFRTIGFSEVEPYACKVLAERWPGIPNLGDVRRRKSFAGLHPTVITGGFPCQPWSCAGERGGTTDDRHLWPAMRDLVAAHRPTWVIGENVSGIIQVGLDLVCADLEALGYAVQPFAIPAGAVGAHHRRERVWIVAHLDCDRQLEREGRGGEVGGRPIDEAQEVPPDPDRQRLRLEPKPDTGRGGQAEPTGPLSPDVDGNGRRAGEVLRAGQPDARPGGEAADADAAGGRRKGRSVQKAAGRAVAPDISADPLRAGLHAPAQAGVHSGEEAGARDVDPAGPFQWPAESPLVRVVHGIPNRAHRIKGLGNSIVPQVAQPFFAFIRQIERGEVA